MTKILDWLVKACDELGLGIDAGYVIVLGNGHQIGTVARIRDLGAKNGMLIISQYSQVKQYQDEVKQLGYAFSVLDEPSPQESYDHESFIEMFHDWGWAGAEAKRPDWFGC